MLTLNQIVKIYDSANKPVHALKGVSITFRPSEFVAILGHSGCGKTTLLNIIGGLDRYSEGDLIIRGKSTKNFKDKDWDTYRNHSVGFVFQSYNLIPHQTVLANVELALTLSGVSKTERRRRATEALEKVGLGDQISKKPNQLSGGQMQRVAIARALVNDPEILLADEPTGALDSETSIQVMELLKQIAQDRLVVMVTHNPELAESYATRTVRLVDGLIVSDSDPYEEAADEKTNALIKMGRASMSALTAFSLSLSNLLTKKGRTILTAFAGSIGIIGIALILSISTGINNYIDSVEKDTLSSYPLTLESQTIDMGAMMGSMQPNQNQIVYRDDKIYSANVMSSMMDMMLSSATTNDLAEFKQFLESGKSGIPELTSEIRYLYGTPLNIYKADLSNGIYQINPNTVFAELGMENGGNGQGGGMNVWVQLTANRELMETQYQVLDGELPDRWNEVVLVVDENNRITDFTLYSLGVLDIEQLRQALQDAMAGNKPQIDTTVKEYAFSDFLGMEFKLMPSSSYYQKENGVWVDKREDDLFMTAQLQNAEPVTIVGIVRPKSDAVGTTTGVIGYTGELMTHLINTINQSAIVQEQKQNPNIDVFTGLPFADPNAEAPVYTMEQIQAMMAHMPADAQTQLQGLIAMMRGQGKTDEEIATTISKLLAKQTSSATLESNLQQLGVSDLDDPLAINLYPIDFEAKDAIAQIIADYNAGKDKEEQIIYTDFVGLMMSSITTIINAISYILIAFVGISLVVSSIMIGIITNISVLERTKEIGILRAVGASKKDISRVFNAETFIVGLTAGLVGIGITELLLIPTNALIQVLAGLEAEATLSFTAAAVLVAISVGMTMVAGLIPAKKASRKDPVVALRTE
jgi:putative ABC transport system permease protein